jgi:RNA polymerase sigma factor (sigma-70 family)
MKNELEKYYRKNKDRHVGTIRKIVHNPEDAEDIVQGAFLRALTYLPSYDPNRAPLGNWFTRILFNNMSATLRIKKRLPTICIDHIPALESDDNTEKALENLETLLFINESIKNIKNEDHKKMVYLYYIEGLTYSEISKIYRTPESNVRKITLRFRETLQREYRKVV